MSARGINSQINSYDVLLKSYPLIKQPRNSHSSAGCVLWFVVLCPVGCGEWLVWAVLVVDSVSCGHCFAVGSPCCAAAGTCRSSSAQLAA